jgi:hypothetical protein
MDRVDGRTIGERVRAAAGDAGILPADPLGPVVEALADIPAEIDLRLAPILAEMQEARKAAAQPLSDKQIDDIGRQLMGGCQGWARSFVRASYWRSQSILAVALLGAIIVGFGAGWRAHTPPSELACADQADGSRICWMYTRLPTQPTTKVR